MHNRLDIRIPIISSTRALKARGSLWFNVITIAFAVFTDTFLYAVIVPVIPYAFVSRMGIEFHSIQAWVSRSLSVYASGVIFGGLVIGFICDKLGYRRSSMLLGLAMLIATTLILCLTKSIALFMVGRAMQGFSAGAVWTVGFAVMADVAPRDKVATTMGYPAVGMSIGMFSGPLIGGIVYEKAGYYPVFYVSFGILVFDILLRLLMVEKSTLKKKLTNRDEILGPQEELFQENEQIHTVEIIGAGTSQQSLEDANVEVNEQQNQRQQAQRTASPRPAANHSHKTLMFGIRVPPIISLLGYPRVLNCMLQNFVISWTVAALDATLTIHFIEIFDFNSLQSGLMFLAIAVPMVLEPVAGYLCDRYGSKYLMAAGFLAAMPFVILLRLPDHRSTQQIVLFVVFLALIGLSFCFVFAPMLGELTVVIMQIESKHPGKFGPGKGFGQAYALMNIASATGSLVGPFHGQAAIENGGWNLASLTIGIICGFMAIPTLLFTDKDLVSLWYSKRHLSLSLANNSGTDTTTTNIDNNNNNNNSQTSIEL